jgi:hypothetical protein
MGAIATPYDQLEVERISAGLSWRFGRRRFRLHRLRAIHPSDAARRQHEDLHARVKTVPTPLKDLGEGALCPGSAALAKLNASLG